jgi:hypothetical protein
MGELLLKQEVSLTVLKVRLLEGPPSSIGDVAAETTTSEAVPGLRILCELEVTGKAEERGFTPLAGNPTSGSTSRRKRGTSRPSYDEWEESPSPTIRTVAQWSFAAEEMQLPVHFGEAERFREKPTLAGGFIADIARVAVTKLLPEFRVDTLERFASTKTWLPSGKPALPSTMTRQLVTLLPSLMHDGDCLWLDLAEPAGYLPLLPWEEMLRLATSAPILRLSPHSVKALSSNLEQSVVLCLTVPSNTWIPTKDQLVALARAIRKSLPKGSKLHVFADDLCHVPFAAAMEAVGSADDQGRVIILYELPGSPPENAPEKEKLSEQPWMEWIMTSLSGRAVDIVHCCSPGVLYTDHARAVIARNAVQRKASDQASSTDESVTGRPLRYITPLEHSNLLTSLGAWGAIFSAPPRGDSVASSRQGLRLFVDQLARLRPGVVTFHDFATDPTCDALASTYEFMIGDPSKVASTSPSVTVYCHPARATAAASAPSLLPNELMKQYARIEETIQSVIASSGPLPAWVAATQRIVEQAVSRAAITDANDSHDAVVRGVASALQYIEEMISKQMHTDVSPQSEPASTPQEEISRG